MRTLHILILMTSLVGGSVLTACDRKSREKSDPSTHLANGSAEENQAEDESAGEPASESDDCQLVEEGFGPSGDVAVEADEVVANLEVPWGILFLDDTGENMLVTERSGKVRLVQKEQLVREPVAEVPVIASGEGGLLGMQAHPDFEQNRLFYLYYTAEGDDGSAINRVERWKLSEDARSAEADQVIVDDIPAAAFHNGGRMRVGPDGMLYIGTGDAREAQNSQDRDTTAGKILRVTLDGEVPEDNPWPDNPAYIMGIRNTQGFDWRDDETMLVSDHGPSGEMGRTGHDEVNVATPGTNLGWPTIYGCEDQEGLRPPSLTWSDAVPPGGATIYTGGAIAEWNGDLILGTLGSRHLHRVTFEEGTRTVEKHDVYFQGDPPDGLGRIRETIMGPDGHLYVTTSNCDGRGTCPDDGDKVYRILPE